MKRIFVILLLSIHLFYIGGYNLFYQYFIHEADLQMSNKVLANDINKARLIELKIPVRFQTIDDDQEYRMVAGQIQYKGTYYNYMQMKTTRDTMFFVCLPNTVKTNLEKAKSKTTKEVSDSPVNKKGHDTSIKKVGSVSEYNLQAFSYSYVRFGVFMLQHRLQRPAVLSKPYISSPGKPPNHISC